MQPTFHLEGNLTDYLLMAFIRILSHWVTISATQIVDLVMPVCTCIFLQLMIVFNESVYALLSVKQLRN